MQAIRKVPEVLPQEIEEPQGGLLEFLFLFFEYRVWFFSALVASVLVSGVLAMTLPKVYQGRASFYLPSPQKSGFSSHAIPSLAEFEESLRERFEVDNPLRRAQKFPFLSSVMTPALGANQRRGGIVSLTARGDSADQVRGFLDDLSKSLVSDLETVYRASIDLQKKELEDLRKRFLELREEADSLKKIRPSGEMGSASISGFSMLERGQIMREAARLQSEIYRTEASLLASEREVPRIVMQAKVLADGRPVQPRPVLYVVLGATVGVVLGSILVVLVHLVQVIRSSKHI